MPSRRPGGIGQTRRHAPAHASHHEPRARPVAAGARRALAFYGRRVTSPPPLRSSEPTPSAKRVPAWERSSGGRGSDLTRANGGAFGKLNKWRCERMKPPSAARKINDGPRRTGTAAAPRKSGAAARGMAPTPWRGCHRVGRRAVLQIRRSPLPSFPLRSRRPELRSLDTVALRLKVQGLVVHPEEPSCLALVPPRGVKCQADRLSLRLGGGAVGDLLQGGAHLFSSSVARSHGGADQPSQFADQ